MTQPTEAVGGDGNPAEATPDTNPFEDIASEMLGEDQEEEETPPDSDAEAPEAEAELEDDDDIEVEAEELPPIDPPVSWSAEEKAEFAALPREVQETLTKREAQREKFVQTKAQEAAQAREAARAEALQFAEQMKAHHAEQLSRYAAMFEVRPPDAALFAQNPQAYAQQLEAYQTYAAHRENAEREAAKAQAERDQYNAALQQHEAQAFRQQLEAELPEAFGEGGQQFINGLAATAQALGYDDNSISQATVEELKALKTVGEWKADAEKYRKAMANKMERVRAGKNPPPIAKPGVSKGPEASRKARADQAWEIAKTAKSRPQRDDALAAWAEANGYLD